MPNTNDTEYLAREAFITGYQVASLLVPPVYIATLISRRRLHSLSINNILRVTWLGGLGGGVVYGGSSYFWYTRLSEDKLRDQRLRTSLDNDRVKANDYATIGAFLMAFVTPAIFWNRAHTIDLLLGGASIGSGLGLLTHYQGRFSSAFQSRVPTTSESKTT